MIRSIIISTTTICRKNNTGRYLRLCCFISVQEKCKQCYWNNRHQVQPQSNRRNADYHGLRSAGEKHESFLAHMKSSFADHRKWLKELIASQPNDTGFGQLETGSTIVIPTGRKFLRFHSVCLWDNVFECDEEICSYITSARFCLLV